MRQGRRGRAAVVLRDSPARRGVVRVALSRPLPRAMAGRLSWGVADQAVSSLTNFVVGVVVARSLGTAAFGIFGLTWVTYAVALNLSRGVATDPLMVRFSGAAPARLRAAIRQASGAALVIGVVTGIGCVAGGLVLGGGVGGAFVALGLVLPALLVQDSWRFGFFAAGQGRKACLNDLVWGASLVPALGLAHESGSVFHFVLAWGLASGVAAIVGGVQTRAVPLVSGVPRWLRGHRDLGPRYMLENLLGSSGSQLRMYGLGAIAGLAAVGAVRGAVLLLGPFLAVLMGLSLVAVPEAARVLRGSPRHLTTFCLLFGAAQAVAALAWSLVLLFGLPDAVGIRVLGQVWGPASALVVPVTLEVMAASVATAAGAGLRALGAATRSLRAQAATSTGYVAGGLGGAALAGAAGSAWGVATAVTVTSALWWVELRWALRARASNQPMAPEPPPEQTEVRIP